MADVNVSVNENDYSKSIDNMIAKNNELIASLRQLGVEQRKFNKTSGSGAGSAAKTSRNTSANVASLFNQMFNRKIISGNGNVEKVLGSINKSIQSLVSRVSNSSIVKNAGAKSIGGIIGKAADKFGGAVKNVLGPESLKRIGTIGVSIGAIVTSLVMMSKAGNDAYKQNAKLNRSLSQLGDGADSTYRYAKRLNDELGVPLQKSISNISKLAQQLKSVGGFSTGAAGVAAGAYDISTRLGLMYQIDPNDVFEQMQKAIINGENTLSDYNVQVSDDVLAGWLAAKKGINMYSTELSAGAKQAYRWMMIQEQLNDVTSSTADLTNSAFAKQLQMMNKLEEIGLKLKGLFMPLFVWLTDQTEAIVDSVLGAVNQLRNALGMESIEIETNDMVVRNQEILSAIDKQNAAYRKQGELLKKNANQRLPFDEWISLESVQQLNDELEKTTSETFDSLGSFDGSKPGESKTTFDIIDDVIKKNNPVTIKTIIETSDSDGLVHMFDNMNLVQKGQYGVDIGVELLEHGKLSDGLLALILGTGGELVGVGAIKEFAEGNWLPGISDSVKTIGFLFGGWKTKLGAVAGAITDTSLQLAGFDSNTSSILSTVTMIGIAIGGWPGLLTAALTALVPLGARFGEVLGVVSNKAISKSVGADGLWGKLQSWDSRTAANMEYGKDTPEAEAYYYRLMNEKFGDDVNIPAYANGGIALTPHIAEIGHGREGVIPLGSSIGQNFASDLAGMITANQSRDPLNDANRSVVSVTAPIQYFMGDETSLRRFAETIHNMINDIERNEGGSFSGTY